MFKIHAILKSSYIKILFTVVLGFAGIVSGIYVGHALVNQTAEPVVLPQEENVGITNSELDARYVNFTAGDLFPREEFTAVSGETGQFEQLVEGKNTLVFFVSFGCEPCHELLAFFNHNLYERLNPDVQLVACLRDATAGIPTEYAGLLKHMMVVFYDSDYWAEQYDLDFWPTIIGVDNSGFVRHVQLGWEEYIDYPLMEFYFKPGQ